MTNGFTANPGTTRSLITDLRDQLVALANTVQPFGELPDPSRHLAGRFDDATGPVWDVPTKNEKALAVVCVDGEPGVFIEGAGHSDDWHALPTGEARAFAMAVLAAADWSDRKGRIEEEET